MRGVSVVTLFDEYATRYLRGEQPDAREYLERASEGAERGDLAGLLDRFLEAAPARAPSEEEIVLMEARLEQEPPILVLRRRRKLTREAVVSALVGRLGLDPAKRGKVGGYYHELETGLLDPAPVDLRVWDALADLLKANVRGLAGLRPEPPAAFELAYRREPGEMPAPLLESVVAAAGAPEPAEPEHPAGPDEVDRLFRGRDAT